MLFDNIAVQKYREQSTRMISLLMPNIPIHVIDEAISHSIREHALNHKAKIYNSYKSTTVDTDIYALTQYILSRKPIITTYGVLFEQHETVPNPLRQMFARYIAKRPELKQKMYEYEVGSEMFERYNLMQTLMKLNANA